LVTAAASATMQWAWISTIFDPLAIKGTTSRHRWVGVSAKLVRLDPTNAMPANAPTISSLKSAFQC
jgi:hypothetical protein